MKDMNYVQPISDEEIDTVTGGTSYSTEKEIYCPHCGCVTVSTRTPNGKYVCTICNTSHNGKDMYPKPRA